VGEIYNHSFELKEGLLGGCAIDATGEPFQKRHWNSASPLMQFAGGRRRTEMDNLPGTKDLKRVFLEYAEHWACMQI